MEAARRATDDDVPVLAALCRDALAELGARERGGAVFVAREARGEPLEEGLRQTVRGPDSIAVLGTIDHVPVGYGTGRLEALRDGRCLGIVDDIFVVEDARAVGVGEALMGELLGWFTARGCSGVDATALPGARETKNFFEETGFTARLLIMHRRLES